MAKETQYLRALLIAAPSHQGGHSASGAAIAEALEVPFPLTMPSLRAAAIDSGFLPYDLWPWLERMEGAAREFASAPARKGE